MATEDADFCGPCYEIGPLVLFASMAVTGIAYWLDQTYDLANGDPALWATLAGVAVLTGAYRLMKRWHRRHR